MGRIAEASLEDIRERTDIVELVREYIPGLKRAGRNHKACCPFHQEKTPSFMVNPEKQIFHCFGCGKGGSVFDFVMEMEGLSFREAMEKLAERAGLRIARPERKMGPKEKERVEALRALEFAREHYHELLLNLPEAEKARKYLAKRGVSRETIEKFKIGFAPRAKSLLPAAARKGFTSDVLKRAGLAADRQGRVRDYFWDRVVYPILNSRGEVVGFGARMLGEGEPKYLNSPDSGVFSKGRVLYGLHDALPAVRKDRKALLLEGYMDVIAAHQFGVRHACAPLGTALTEDHVAMLKRYAERVAIVFDPDAAGAKAALRGAELLLEKGVSVVVATLPDGLDPDELLHKRGTKALAAALKEAEDLVSYKTRLLLEAVDGVPGPEDKARVAREVLETIRKTPDEVLKSEWTRRLSELLSVDVRALEAQLRKGGGKRPGRPEAKRAPSAPLPVEERDVLLCLLKSPALAQGGELVAETDFTDERARRVFTALLEVLGRSEGHEAWAARLLEALQPGDAVLVRELFVDAREVADPERVAAEIVGRMRKTRRLAEIEPLVIGGKPGAPVDPELCREYNRLLKELKGTRKGA